MNAIKFVVLCLALFMGWGIAAFASYPVGFENGIRQEPSVRYDAGSKASDGYDAPQQSYWRYDAASMHNAADREGAAADALAHIAIFAEFVAADSAGAGIVTPYGTATQEFSAEALEAQQAAQNGATLYKGGVLGQSTGPEAQFWSLENPLSPGYAEKYGIPAENMNFDFIQTGKLTPGSNFITNEAMPQTRRDV